jgi:protein TonB
VAYQARLQAWLKKHQRYPRRARQRGQTGVAEISFQVGAGGEVSDLRIVRSSGHGSLDRAALAMVRRAVPLPVPPGKGAARRFRVPVAFRLVDAN